MVKNRAFDTIFIGKANRDLTNRKAGNQLDRHLAALEEALLRRFQLRVNKKLLSEYASKVGVASNEIVAEFLVFVIDSVTIEPSSTVPRKFREKVKKTRWPSHDNALLAAVLGKDSPGVFVFERRHRECAGSVLRHLKVQVFCFAEH